MRLLTSAAWLALFAGAGFTFLVERGYLGAAVAPDLALLPAHIGTLEVLEEIPLEPGSLGTQPPERYAFRRVLDARGAEGRLFVAYYARAQRWSGRPHDVEKCYAALGWQELEARRLVEPIAPGRGSSSARARPSAWCTGSSVRVPTRTSSSGASSARA